MSTSPESVSQLDNLLSEPDAGVLSVVGGTTGEFIVLGAGGKMGFHVCRMLQRSLEAAGRSYPIVAVSRFGDLPTRKKFEQAGFDVRAVDLSDRTQLSGLPDAANVINLAGVKFGTQGRPELLQRLNVEMPKLIAERYRDSRIVALSTGCVYSFVTPESGGSTEESRTEPSGAYARSCLGREQAFIDAAERWGTCSSLIRLNYSIDLRYGVLVDIAQKVLAGDPIELSMGYANIIWQRDAISHIIQTLPHSSASPFVINVTGAEIVRIRDVAKACGRRCGRDVTLTGSEAPTAWLSNAEKSHRLFGVPATSTEQMIEWTAAWLQRGGQTLGKPTHFETRDGEY